MRDEATGTPIHPPTACLSPHAYHQDRHVHALHNAAPRGLVSRTCLQDTLSPALLHALVPPICGPHTAVPHVLVPQVYLHGACVTSWKQASGDEVRC
jgi:hypothetical protein